MEEAFMVPYKNIDEMYLISNPITLDFENQTYEIYDGRNHNNRVGTTSNPMKWYEYINPGI
jgi:hypothetical protein